MKTTDLQINRGAAIEKARHMLAEHFDAGVLLLTWMEGDETKSRCARWGNEFAQKAMLGESNDLAGFVESEQENL
jgi:hypothetical protein